MLKESVLFLSSIVLILLVLYKTISITTSVAIYIIIFAILQSDTIYYTWISAKEREAFEQRMSNLVNRINQNESVAIETIPRIIIQVWVQKDRRLSGDNILVPQNQLHYMENFRKLNPSFQHLFFNGDDIDQFFKSNYPEYYNTYKKLPFFIQTLDFFRYLAIYHYGGFYFDMDVEPHKPLDDEILNHSAVFPVDEYANKMDCQNPRMKSYCSVGQNFLLGQYAFGTTAKHPFMKLMVDKIQQNLDDYIKVANQINKHDPNLVHYFVYKTTGPDFVTDCYVQYQNKEQLHILSNGKRQVFGDYASHKYVGAWK